MSALKIYIVEDNPIVRDSLVETLGDLAGAVTVGFSDTELDAIAWLQHPDNVWTLVIIDLYLREGTGLAVLHALELRLPSQKAVVFSNYATDDMRARCRSLGADDVFDKSQNIEALIQFCLAH